MYSINRTISSSSTLSSRPEHNSYERTPNENSTLLSTKMQMMKIARVREVFAQRNLLVDVLTLFFGVGTWLGINSTYNQLPLLVNATPEGWNLASYIVIIIQIGNLGPVLYTLIQKFRPINDCYFIYVLLAIGVGAGFGMAFLYTETATIFGSEHSLSIFVNVLFFALVGCTSSVLFMPYFGRFKELYLITYLIGEGLSGFLPAILALIQGVGGNAQCITNDSGEIESYVPPPRFGTQVFFIIISSLFVASFVSFTLLDRLKSVRKEYAASVSIAHGHKYEYNTQQDMKEAEHHENGTTAIAGGQKTLSDKNYRGLLVLLGFVCMFSNAIFPSVQSFSTLPYGNVAYHLAVTLSSIANPVACFIAVFTSSSSSIRNIIVLCIVSIPPTIYCLFTAVASPTPPFRGMIIGNILTVSFADHLFTLFSR